MFAMGLDNTGSAHQDVGQTAELGLMKWSGSAVRGGFMVVEQDTRLRILAAAKGVLLAVGYAQLSTRGIAEAAGVPLSQIHYHFGSKQNLMLAVLDMENRARLTRQATMYEADKPLWEQWLQACDFFDDD